MKGGWRELHNMELHVLYCSPDIVRVVNSRNMRWVNMWHIEGGREMCTGFW